MLWGRVVQGLARYEERGDAFPGHDVRCCTESFCCVLCLLALLAQGLLQRADAATLTSRVGSAVISISRGSVVCRRSSPHRLQRVLLESMTAKASLNGPRTPRNGDGPLWLRPLGGVNHTLILVLCHQLALESCADPSFRETQQQPWRDD